MKKTSVFSLTDAIRGYFSIQPFMEIMPWIERNINLADDVSSERDRPVFSQSPYQVEILRQWEDMGVRKHVIVVSCEQMREDLDVPLWPSVQDGVRPMPDADLLSV